MSNKIIVVGNGSSLIQKENGILIDAYDDVVRFNYFVTDGYEKHVGTKTTLWFAGIGYEPANWRNQLSYKKINVFSWQRIAEKCAAYQEYKKHITHCIVEKVNQKFVTDIQDYTGNKEYYYYSSGAICLSMLLNVYDKITITGFDWWESNKKHHYCDEATAGTLHDPMVEKEYIFKLIADNRVIFL